MKRMIAIVLCIVLFCTAVACGGNADTGNVGNVDSPGKESAAPADKGGSSVAVSGEILEAFGLSEEEWAAMDPAKQEALLAEMGVVLENNAKNEQVEEQQTKPASQKYTPDDVMSGGSYKVVLGDYMNSITLYYENGKLVRLEEAFQKNDEEAAEYATYEGDSLAEYGFNFIDWANASLQDILDGMKDYGEFGQYSIRKND